VVIFESEHAGIIDGRVLKAPCIFVVLVSATARSSSVAATSTTGPVRAGGTRQRLLRCRGPVAGGGWREVELQRCGSAWSRLSSAYRDEGKTIVRLTGGGGQDGGKDMGGHGFDRWVALGVTVAEGQ
jgi:hypothetical protein